MIPLPFSIKLMNIAHLSLGTNLGNKLANLNNALQKLSQLGTVLQISSIYQTPPWGFESDDFFNIALSLQTNLDANTLIIQLLTIEEELGRIRKPTANGYAARPLDIDILFFNDEIIQTENLIIPHPRIQDRKFVLIPLLEILQNFQHPVFKKTLEKLLKTCNDDSTLTKRTDLSLTL
ncbi:2-amino-4-hydroxy-6-hydroxymethyldihydropteridine diphosphokinase [Wenyingzhuangia sp. 2_MG-2023]|uniref:2-amino-4-hydroxy-6- hydroxymethyldihydropteridine diphosphokinase n=1 Tax=Wenyingzhuangia sp. 2_MG-2023 TaxID=3062639 RepID=UPI0026E35B6F|nr:2-amino-4-hydroxy-6-hydroxymethyldihydropteridine diphosphokinase [Wenyingzhuangia sp. 2_MG-2023]MDO6737871.1 2-amino-4-hydroxy-6-hydroxymethyldihydropteridine diphosphokinase [Wenyingzhuangia sp. 2_MG-2023]